MNLPSTLAVWSEATFPPTCRPDPLRPRSPNRRRDPRPAETRVRRGTVNGVRCEGMPPMEGLTATPQAFMGAHQPWQDHRGGGGQDKNSWLLTPVTGDASA